MPELVSNEIVEISTTGHTSPGVKGRIVDEHGAGIFVEIEAKGTLPEHTRFFPFANILSIRFTGLLP